MSLGPGVPYWVPKEGSRNPPSGLPKGAPHLFLFLSKIHSGPVTALHVLPEFLVTASKDRDVKLWERPSMQLVSVYVCVCVCVRRTKGMSESKLGVRKDRRSKLFSSLLLAIMCN